MKKLIAAIVVLALLIPAYFVYQSNQTYQSNLSVQRTQAQEREYAQVYCQTHPCQSYPLTTTTP